LIEFKLVELLAFLSPHSQ